MPTIKMPKVYYCEGKDCEYTKECGRCILNYSDGFEYFGKIKTCRNKELFFPIEYEVPKIEKKDDENG